MCVCVCVCVLADYSRGEYKDFLFNSYYIEITMLLKSTGMLRKVCRTMETCCHFSFPEGHLIIFVRKYSKRIFAMFQLRYSTLNVVYCSITALIYVRRLEFYLVSWPTVVEGSLFNSYYTEGATPFS